MAEWKRGTCAVSTSRRGPVSVECERNAGVAGLALVRFVERDEHPEFPGHFSEAVSWRVTHEASGLSIGPVFQVRKTARALFSRLAPLTDWTLPGNRVLSAEGVRDAVSNACAAFSTLCR